MHLITFVPLEVYNEMVVIFFSVCGLGLLSIPLIILGQKIFGKKGAL